MRRDRLALVLAVSSFVVVPLLPAIAALVVLRRRKMDRHTEISRWARGIAIANVVLVVNLALLGALVVALRR